MKVEIDQNSGFCFGVVYAVQMAEEEIDRSGSVYCLGDIVHNDVEVKRLTNKGLKIIYHEDLPNLKNCKVLIRAHGEPPETYKIAIENNIELIDASCPVVLKLQNRVKNSFDKVKQDGQLVIYGKHGHAEVKGLLGQTNQEAIVVMTEEDVNQIDFTKPITLYSQTTKSTEGFYKLKSLLEQKTKEHGFEGVDSNDTICRQVSNRAPQLEKFSQEYDVIIFVSSQKSSNGKVLYQTCKNKNPSSYFISDEHDLDTEWFSNATSVGICGATSTPMWLMEQVANHIQTKYAN